MTFGRKLQETFTAHIYVMRYAPSVSRRMSFQGRKGFSEPCGLELFIVACDELQAVHLIVRVFEDAAFQLLPVERAAVRGGRPSLQGVADLCQCIE